MRSTAEARRRGNGHAVQPGLLARKLRQSITGGHAGPVKNAADLDILVIKLGAWFAVRL